MRVALVLGALLSVVAVGAADAKPANHGVTGGVGYYAVNDFGNPDLYRHLSVTAETGRPNLGNFIWQRPEGNYSGDVTCVTQSGSDVWIAGSVTHNGPNNIAAIFAWVHDGGPGMKGDQVFVWGADPGQTLADMDAACEAMDTYAFFDDPVFWVTSGNATVH